MPPIRRIELLHRVIPDIEQKLNIYVESMRLTLGVHDVKGQPKRKAASVWSPADARSLVGPRPTIAATKMKGAGGLLQQPGVRLVQSADASLRPAAQQIQTQ